MDERFPWGWFGAGLTSDIPRGAAMPATVNGRELAVYRTAAGALVALDAHCPHLGAHMGRGGTVEGDTLRCHFHGFCFDAEGRCVRTGYGTKPPPKARVRGYPVLDFGGVVVVWFEPDGRAPSYTPTLPDADGWCDPRGHSWTFTGRPQEIAENSVDLGHLGVVHGYERTEIVGDVRVEGPVLHAEIRFWRPLPLYGRRGPLAEQHARITQYGLGLAHVENVTPSIGARSRFVIASTSLDAARVALHTSVAIRSLRHLPRLGALQGALPTGSLDELAMRSLLASFIGDIEQDVPVWSHKRYLERPALAEGDGPIGRYRSWARQFYTAPRPAEPTDAA